MTKPNFTIDKSRLRQLVESGEASNAAVTKAHERLRDKQADAQHLLSELDTVRTRKAARPRYLDNEVEQAERVKHEGAIATAQAAYQSALNEAQASHAAYSARQAIAAEAMGLARSCKDYAARFGMKI